MFSSGGGMSNSSAAANTVGPTGFGASAVSVGGVNPVKGIKSEHILIGVGIMALAYVLSNRPRRKK